MYRAREVQHSTAIIFLVCPNIMCNPTPVVYHIPPMTWRYAPFSEAFSMTDTSAELPSTGGTRQQWALLKRPLHEVLAVAFPTTPEISTSGPLASGLVLNSTRKSWLFSVRFHLFNTEYLMEGVKCAIVSKAKHKFTAILSLQHTSQQVAKHIGKENH